MPATPSEWLEPEIVPAAPQIGTCGDLAIGGVWDDGVRSVILRVWDVAREAHRTGATVERTYDFALDEAFAQYTVGEEVPDGHCDDDPAPLEVPYTVRAGAVSGLLHATVAPVGDRWSPESMPVTATFTAEDVVFRDPNHGEFHLAEITFEDVDAGGYFGG